MVTILSPAKLTDAEDVKVLICLTEFHLCIGHLLAMSDFVCLIFYRMLYDDLVRDKMVTNLKDEITDGIKKCREILQINYD
jgi:hypothetical protein